MRADRVSPMPGARPTDTAQMPRLILSGRSVAEFREGLNVGQVLSGHVLAELDGSRSLVQFNGFNLVTQSETPLNPGAQIHAEVTNIGDQVMMRLLPMGGGLDNAAALLEELGIPATRANIEVLALMSRAGIPLTPDNVQQVFEQLQALPGGHEAVESLLLSRMLEAPASPATLQTIQSLTETQTPLATRLAEIAGQIERLAPQVPATQTEALTALGQTVSSMPIRPEGDATLEQLRHLLQQLGQSYENALLNAGSARASLRGLLLAARTELTQLIMLAEQNATGTATLHALRNNLDGLLTQLDAFQILARIPAQNLPHLYMHIPYWGAAPGSPLTLTVKGRKDDPTGEMDADNTEIEFAVRTRRWGVVHLRFVIRDGRIRAAIETESPEAREVVEGRIGRLVSRIERLGYSVTQMTALVARALDPDPPILPRLELVTSSFFDMEV